MNKFTLLIRFLIVFFFITACSPGYIDKEPKTIITTRPSRPSVSHVWINDSWVWRQRNHNYSPRSGYWAKPHRGRTYNQGSWNSSPRGYRWKPGRWH
jgi:hypothetical protein